MWKVNPQLWYNIPKMIEEEVGPRVRTLCIVHVFYPDFWPEIASCLRSIDEPLDLVVTYVDETKGIPEMVRRDFPDARFVLCENRGFDIWPFLKALKTVDLSRYSVLVKLHTKRDVKRDGRPLVFNHCDFAESAWREYLLGFIRDAESWRATMVRLSHPGVGMVADRHVIMRRTDTPWFNTRRSMDAAVEFVQELYGTSVPGNPQFVAGTMFAARPVVFARLLARGWSADDFSESVRDGTEQTAHMLERVLGVVVSAEGLRIDSPRGDLARWRLGVSVRDALAAVVRFIWSDSVVNGRRIVKVMGVSIYRSARQASATFSEIVAVPAPANPLDYGDLLRAYVMREMALRAGKGVYLQGPIVLPHGGSWLRRMRTRTFVRKRLKPDDGPAPNGIVETCSDANVLRAADQGWCWSRFIGRKSGVRKMLFCHFHSDSREARSIAMSFAAGKDANVRFFSDDAGSGGPAEYVDALANSDWVMTDTETGRALAENLGKPLVDVRLPRKRVLLVSHELSVTGAPNSLLRQARYFLSAGCAVDVWTMAEGELLARYREAGLSPELVANDRRAIEAKYAERRIRYDLAVCNTICTYKFVDVLRRCGMPVVWFIRETKLLDESIWWDQDFERVFRSFPNLYTVSEYNAAVIRDYNPRVRVIHNAVADQFAGFSPVTKSIRFGFIGSFIPVKGLDILIEAFRKVRAGFPDLKLHIAGRISVGDGEKLAAETSGDSSIVWVGEVQGEAKRAFFDSIDVLCVPSLDEPCGLTVLEAAMYGKAVVTTDRTGANYVVDGSSGRIVRAGDVESLAAALRDMASMGGNAIRAMGEHARTRYLKLSSPEVERAAVLKMLDDNAGRVPHVWRRMRYEDESPLVVEKRYEDGRRLFYFGKFRFLKLLSEGVKKR